MTLRPIVATIMCASDPSASPATVIAATIGPNLRAWLAARAQDGPGVERIRRVAIKNPTKSVSFIELSKFDTQIIA